MKKYLTFLSFILTLNSCLISQDQDVWTVIQDLSYYQGEGVPDELQKLNLVLPREAKNVPLLIWIGGGAWSYVDRNVEIDLAKMMAKEGIAVACIGHRLSSAVWKDPKLDSGVKHPEHIKDVAMAFKWLYEHAETYGYSSEKIVIGGFSSGAHLASLLALDGKYLQAWGLNTQIIKGMIPISGTYDVADYHRAFRESETRSHLAKQHVEAVFGDSEEGFADASPINFVENLSCPMLLISDNGSGIVSYTRLFEERIKATGFEEAEYIYVEELGHGELWRDISHNEESKYRRKICSFLKKVVDQNG